MTVTTAPSTRRSLLPDTPAQYVYALGAAFVALGIVGELLSPGPPSVGLGRVVVAALGAALAFGSVLEGKVAAGLGWCAAVCAAQGVVVLSASGYGRVPLVATVLTALVLYAACAPLRSAAQVQGRR